LYSRLYSRPVETVEVGAEIVGAVAEKAALAVGNGSGVAGKSGHKGRAGSAKSGDGRRAAAKKVSTSSKG
jgi:hypothetical protein